MISDTTAPNSPAKEAQYLRALKAGERVIETAEGMNLGRVGTTYVSEQEGDTKGSMCVLWDQLPGDTHGQMGTSVTHGTRRIRDVATGYRWAGRAWGALSRASAYLVVICDPTDNSVAEVAIWSSPEWEQSMCLPESRTYVLYTVKSDTYAHAEEALRETIAYPQHRYNWASQLLDKPASRGEVQGLVED